VTGRISINSSAGTVSTTTPTAATPPTTPA